MTTDDRAESFIKSKCDTDLTIQIERYELVDLVREYCDIETKARQSQINRLVLAVADHVNDKLELKADNDRLKEGVDNAYHTGYAKGYDDATSEACQEIRKNYQPKQ